MEQGSRLHAATNENLLEHALEPAMRWLIATALNSSTMTYGALKRRLEREASFSTIFATRIGFVAGELMNAILRVEPEAPLINVLVVNQEDLQPSRGAGSYMARRFNNSQLGDASYKERYPARWKSYFKKAAGEIYAYSSEDWSLLYQRVFSRSFSIDEIQSQREALQQGNEDDFGAGPGKYGAGGEGEHHKALRLWVTANPHALDRSYAGARGETEFSLDSGDRVDAVYHLSDRAVVLEVKSRISNDVDLRRGVFQCIKYRAVKIAMDVREDAEVEAMLVTETAVPGEITRLLQRHGIRHRQVPLQRN